jgi:Protein of unknown function (DUF3108)
MSESRAWMRCLGTALLLVLSATCPGRAQDAQKTPPVFKAMKLTYRVEWRLVTAGNVDLEFTRAGGSTWQTQMKLESAGLVNRLFRVQDSYRAFMDERFCGSSAHLDAQEGKRHTITQLNFDYGRKKSIYDEKDLVKNTSKHVELDIPPCTHDIVGALAEFGQLDLQPGKSTTLPVTDGKKLAKVRIEARGKETITIDDKKYPAIRYEVFVFDNILYKRKGSLQIWLTDDAEKAPVQFRFQLGFPVGTISVNLVKKQDL